MKGSVLEWEGGSRGLYRLEALAPTELGSHRREVDAGVPQPGSTKAYAVVARPKPDLENGSEIVSRTCVDEPLEMQPAG